MIQEWQGWTHRYGSWMIFVDGENLAIRGKHFAKARGLELHVGASHVPDVFLWLPDTKPAALLHTLLGGAPDAVLRSYYYTSCAGSQKDLQRVRRSIRDAGFEPKVFPRTKTRDSKGVDIAMARDVLVHGIDGGYQSCLLIAGDGDYIPLVEEVKRRGRQVVLSFFESDLNEDLRIEADVFHSLEPAFEDAWKRYLFPRLRGAMIRGSMDSISVGLFGKRNSDGTESTNIHRVRFEHQLTTLECDVPPELTEHSTGDAIDHFLRTLLLSLPGKDADRLRSAL